MINNESDYKQVMPMGEGYYIVNDGGIGLITEKGDVLIPPKYYEIECVNILENFNSIHPNSMKETSWGAYNKKNIFDTDEENPSYWLIHYIVGYNYNHEIYNNFGSDINRGKTFILKTRYYSELFTLKDGIINNSRYDKIYQLTNNSFVVCKDGKYGIYRSDIQRLVLQCEYERIVYEGGHVVLLFRNERWGASSLSYPLDSDHEELWVHVPCDYLEISIMNPSQSLFCVKSQYQTYWGEDKIGYTLIDRGGKILEVLDSSKFNAVWDISPSYPYFDSMFDYINDDIVITSHRGKYGCISLKGFISIPFKYDTLLKREDSNFDVRIGDLWGVLNKQGREFVAVKYEEKLPNHIAGIVKDGISHTKGVLSDIGTEIVPTIYDHLIESNDLYFFGHGGFEDDRDDYTDFFCNRIKGAVWGCIDSKGENIIEPKYDCFKIVGKYILAGREGGMLYHSVADVYYADDYGGIYDLYSREGEFIFGGFSKFEIVSDNLLFFIGGTWVEHKGDYHTYWHVFEERDGKWLFTDENLKVIIKGKTTETTIPKGYIAQNEKSIVWNIPIELLTTKKPV